MARSDFNYIPFSHTFTDDEPQLTVEFPIEGNVDPIDDGYLLITAHNATNNAWQGNKIYINNQELPGWDIAWHDPGWQTWMDHIPSGFLHSGTNSIMVVRVGDDDLTTKDIVVHWRE